MPKQERSITKETWAERSKKVLAVRKNLMAKVRDGDSTAIEQLAREFRCRIWREEEARDIPAQRPARRA